MQNLEEAMEFLRAFKAKEKKPTRAEMTFVIDWRKRALKVKRDPKRKAQMASSSKGFEDYTLVEDALDRYKTRHGKSLGVLEREYDYKKNPGKAVAERMLEFQQLAFAPEDAWVEYRYLFFLYIFFFCL